MSCSLWQRHKCMIKVELLGKLLLPCVWACRPDGREPPLDPSWCHQQRCSWLRSWRRHVHSYFEPGWSVWQEEMDSSFIMHHAETMLPVILIAIVTVTFYKVTWKQHDVFVCDCMVYHVVSTNSCGNTTTFLETLVIFRHRHKTQMMEDRNVTTLHTNFSRKLYLHWVYLNAQTEKVNENTAMGRFPHSVTQTSV